jgi:hypothetical protein
MVVLWLAVSPLRSGDTINAEWTYGGAEAVLWLAVTARAEPLGVGVSYPHEQHSQTRPRPRNAQWDRRRLPLRWGGLVDGW